MKKIDRIEKRIQELYYILIEECIDNNLFFKVSIDNKNYCFLQQQTKYKIPCPYLNGCYCDYHKVINRLFKQIGLRKTRTNEEKLAKKYIMTKWMGGNLL